MAAQLHSMTDHTINFLQDAFAVEHCVGAVSARIRKALATEMVVRDTEDADGATAGREFSLGKVNPDDALFAFIDLQVAAVRLNQAAAHRVLDGEPQRAEATVAALAFVREILAEIIEPMKSEGIFRRIFGRLK